MSSNSSAPLLITITILAGGAYWYYTKDNSNSGLITIKNPTPQKRPESGPIPTPVAIARSPVALPAPIPIARGPPRIAVPVTPQQGAIDYIAAHFDARTSFEAAFGSNTEYWKGH